MKRLAILCLAACSSSDEPPASDGTCQAYSSCELTTQADFAAAIGSSIAPHEKPQGNTKQIYHCAVDSNGSDPYADVAINCRADGRSHEQYLLAHDTAMQLPGFQEITGLGQAAFWTSSIAGSGSLEVEADDQNVIIISIYNGNGMELAGAKMLATKILERR